MAMELPEVSEDFAANIGPFLEAMGEIIGSVTAAGDAVVEQAARMQAAIDAVHGKTIEINVDMGGTGLGGFAGMAAGAEAAANAVRDLGDAEFKLSAASQLQVDTSRMLDQTDALLAAHSDLVTESYARRAADAALLIGAERLLGGETRNAADASGALAAGLSAAGIAATLAGVSITRNVGALGTMVHWIIAGGAELAAVLIPAMVAFGAAAAVAAQGAQNVYTHMSSLYTATEATANMFHTTIGSALGLRSALQQAQNAANPIVYSVLGASVSILSSHFMGLAQVGLDVMRVFQTFSAHLVQTFGAGGLGAEIHGLLSGMVTDLTMFAQILGNAGHALLNFAAAMPGLAGVLLGVADAISRVILWVSQLPAWLITTVMVFEEMWRWGGLLASMVLRLAQAFGMLGTLGIPAIVAILTQFGTIVQSLALGLGLFLTNIGAVIGGLSRFIPAAAGAEAALAGFGGAVFDTVAAIPAWALGIGVVAVGAYAALAVMALHAQSAQQKLVNSMQQTVNAASGMKVFSDIGANMGVLSTQLAQVTTGAHGTAAALTTMGGVAGRLAGPQMTAAGQAASVLSAGLRQQQQDMLNAAQAAEFLSTKYGVSFVGALQLGTQAGVQWDAGIGRMSTAAELNLIKVQDLVHGYQMMGQTAGAVGQDTTVLGIESALQATKIQQLTQAWSTYMGQLTGGTSTLATFEQGLQNIGSVASSSAGSLFQATGKMSASTQQFADSLRSFTGKSAQNWQNFDQVVTTGAQQFITWMQTAGAMGVISGGQMTNAIKGVVAQMIPFATQSQAARVALAGLAAQTGQIVAPTTAALSAWAKGGDSARQLAAMINQVTAKMGDMAAVAQNLGAVMQNDLVAMFDKAKIAASGLPGALNTLSNAMASGGAKASTLQGDISNVVLRLAALHTSLPTISALLSTMGVNLSTAGIQAIIAAGKFSATGTAASRAGGQMSSASAQARVLAAAIAALQSKTITVTTIYQSLHIGGSSAPTRPGMQHGGTVPAAGVYMVGEAGPELAFLPQGTHVLSNPDTERFLSSPGGSGGAPVAAAGSSVIHADATIPVAVQVDGKTIFQAVQRQSFQFQIRNSGRTTGLNIPQAPPAL